jgi:hypothetical protein
MPAGNDRRLENPPREEVQLDEDARRTGRQITQLGEHATFHPSSTRDLDTILKDRRAEAPADLVRFDRVGDALVAPGELIVLDEDPGVEAFLKGQKFVKGLPKRIDADCSTLSKHQRLSLYTYAGTEDPRAESDRVVKALRGRSNPVHAQPAMVTALAAVMKSTDGPAPTSVTADPAFVAAGAHVPAGDIEVAVIDTGIVEALRKDHRLDDVARNGNIDRLDVVPSQGKLDFGAGHGTFAAGVVGQVDPDAKIVVYRALDTEGVASESDIACAMIRAADAGAKVINLSLGMQAVDDGSPCPALRAAVDYIAGLPDGPVIVAAAGNYGTGDQVYPAAFAKAFEETVVVSVAALKAFTDPAATPVGASWSSRGDWVTCSTVGEGIVSTFVVGEEDPEFAEKPDAYPAPGQDDSWALWSGTSFAAPQIAGEISRICREDSLTPRAAADELIVSGTPLAGYGVALHLLPGTPAMP